jgi:hypothetical protein
MFGEEPKRVTEGRRAGKDFLPEASDTCVAVLIRTAHDGRLAGLYRTLLVNLGGDVGLADRLPFAIANIAMTGDGSGKVSIGNGKSATVAQPLAFDAGFTAAYLKGDRRATNVDVSRLRSMAELCLSVLMDPGTCFSAGYAEGGLALSAR